MAVHAAQVSGCSGEPSRKEIMYITPSLHGDISSVSLTNFGDFVAMVLANREDRDVTLFFHGSDCMDKVRRFHKQLGEAIDAVAANHVPLGEQGDGTFRVERSA